jgi:hypothetical protein
MSNFPYSFDDDNSIPPINDNVTQLGGYVINALRSAVFNIEDTLGLNPAGTAGSLANFLSVAHNPDGSIKPSVLTSLGLVTLPITDSQISPTAGIQESKLALAYPTSQLFSFIQQVNLNTQQSLNFITNHGSKIEPHIQGTNFWHFMPAILVAPTSAGYFTNDLGLYRNNTNLHTLFNDINNDYILHQVANNSPVTITNGQQSGGTVPPTNYAHVAAGIYLNTSNFSFVPQTTTDVQSFAEFVDGSNLLLIGTRIQTLYQNGIPRTAVSTSLISQTQGQVVIPSTPVTAYLLDGYLTYPVDDINHGDDVVVFNPANDAADGYYFDALFAAVRIGDILTVNYGTFSVSNIITETKYLVSIDQSTQTFAVRIDGKNLQNSTTATATVTRSLFNNDKFGVLALAQAYNTNFNTGILPTLTVGNPHSAEVLSVNFNPALIDGSHYNLYLVVYPFGNPTNGIFQLPAIDISGNQGGTPGTYTLSSVVQNINNKFRTPGYNNRFIAFEYQGELGIKLADSINNISFSIIDGVLNSTTGLYSQALSNASYPANVIDNINLIDASGLGPLGAGVSSPPYTVSFNSALAAQTPTKIIAPATRKTFYVNGSELERFALQPFQSLDGYGDGYWPGTIIAKTVIAGTRVTVTYQTNLNLSTSGLQIGKTITVIPAALLGSSATFVDSGRYFISNVQFQDCNGCNTNNPASIISTQITVYDAIQSPSGITPYASAPVGTAVNLYFSADTVGFDAENLSDASTLAPFKRFMEVYVDDTGNTFGHERARMFLGNAFAGIPVGSPLTQAFLYGDSSQYLTPINIVGVSPKLRGYPYGGVDKINLQVSSYNVTTGIYYANLCQFNPPNATNLGPVSMGKKGEVVRVYDQSGVEFIDVIFDINASVPSSNFTGGYIDIQLFPTLSLDQDVMLLGTVQVNNQSNTLYGLTDRRQFGNVSPEQLSTASLALIAATPQATLQNGVVRGFDLVSSSPLTMINNISINGGVALVNGSLNYFNPFTVNIPLVQNYNGGSPISTVLWAICANDNEEIQLIPLTSASQLLQLVSLVNSSTYYVDSTTFSALINGRKDLTLLYLVDATLTSSTPPYSFIISDARKYVTDINSNSFMVLSIDGELSNFKSFAAISNWIQFNTTAPPTVILRGMFSLDADLGFSSANYQGDGCIITLNASCVLPNNCSFTNCNFVIVPATGFIIPGTASNISFTNCTFNYTPTFTPSPSSNIVNDGYGAIYSSVVSLLNITVTNCTFTTNTSSRPPFIGFSYTAASLYAQTIHITDNQFSNTSAMDDISSVIAFTCTSTSAQPTEGLKLIDCLIQNNLCDKNQLISITGTFNGSSSMVSSIVPIATRIVNNTCGTISVAGAADNDRNYETTTDGIARDKGYGVIIADNTCRFIGQLNSVGISCFASTRFVAPAISFNSCPMLIQRNQCSWIQLIPNVITAPSTPDVTAYQQNAVLSILDNSLRSYQAAAGATSYYLSLFSVSSSDFINAAIAILAPFNYQVQSIVRGNTVMQGSALNSLGAVVTYDYVNCAYIGSDVTIDGNVFNNLQASSDMVYIVRSPGPNIVITNNQFYRNGTVINSYINVLLPSSGIISNNFFDSSTIDGSNNTLVAGSLAGIVYAGNKNQIGYTSVDLNNASWLAGGSLDNQTTAPTADGLLDIFFPNSVGNRTPYTVTMWAPTSAQAPGQYAEIDLHPYLPPGTQLLYAVIGFVGTSGAGSATGSIQASINVTPPVSSATSGRWDSNPPSSFTGSMADLFSSTLARSYTLGSAAISSSVAYCYANLASDNIIANSGSSIYLALTGGVESTAGTAPFYVSPLLLKYTW